MFAVKDLKENVGRECVDDSKGTKWSTSVQRVYRQVQIFAVRPRLKHLAREGQNLHFLDRAVWMWKPGLLNHPSHIRDKLKTRFQGIDNQASLFQAILTFRSQQRFSKKYHPNWLRAMQNFFFFLKGKLRQSYLVGKWNVNLFQSNGKWYLIFQISWTIKTFIWSFK